MRIFNISKINEIEKDSKRRIAALGFFDGLHTAHQEIIKGAIDKSQNDALSIVITFDKSPKEYFGKTTEEAITPINKKSELLEELGVDEVYYLEFNEKLQTLSAEDFINEILKKLNVEMVFCGYDYRFGNKGIGTPQLIKDSGIEVDIIIGGNDQTYTRDEGLLFYLFLIVFLIVGIVHEELFTKT